MFPLLIKLLLVFNAFHKIDSMKIMTLVILRPTAYFSEIMFINELSTTKSHNGLNKEEIGLL